MSEEKKPDEQSNVPDYLKNNFKSTSTDPGIKFIENFLKYKIDIAKHEHIINVLNEAAIKGASIDKSEDLPDEVKKYNPIEFIRYIIKSDLIFKITHAEMKSIIKKAAEETYRLGELKRCQEAQAKEDDDNKPVSGN